jgi:outer membrane protein
MRILFILLCALVTFTAPAQTTSSSQKIGHADWDYIFSQLPEFKRIENELKIYETQLQSQLKSKNQALESRYKLYQTLPADTPDAIKKDKESELAYLQESIQKFQQEAQLSMQKKQHELVAPVFTKVEKAIGEVARENEFSYIVNPRMMSGGDAFLFVDEKYNISALVLKKLGIIVTDPATIPAKQP